MYKYNEEPLLNSIDYEKGTVSPYKGKLVRRLKDMEGFFSDNSSVKQILKKDNPLIYEVYGLHLPKIDTKFTFRYGISVLYPGKVGNEYFMTKGHFHSVREVPELYIPLKGKGFIIMQDPQLNVFTSEVGENTSLYIPPGWAHRMVNIGKEKLIFFCIIPSDTGQDYGILKKKGFAKLLLEKNGKPVLVDNPRYSD